MIYINGVPQVGISKLSELTIDVSKDWDAKKIENLGAPDTDDDAARKDTPAAVDDVCNLLGLLFTYTAEQ